MSKIKLIFWQIRKFLHFSILRHIHNKRLSWQHLRLIRIVIMNKMTLIGVRLNLKNFLLISCDVMEWLRKVSRGRGGGEGIRPPGEIGLKGILRKSLMNLDLFKIFWFYKRFSRHVAYGPILKFYIRTQEQTLSNQNHLFPRKVSITIRHRNKKKTKTRLS